MRLKKIDAPKKTSRVGFRVTELNLNKMQAKANLYTEGDLAEYILYAALHFLPTRDDYEIEPKKKRGKK